MAETKDQRVNLCDNPACVRLAYGYDERVRVLDNQLYNYRRVIKNNKDTINILNELMLKIENKE